MGVYNALFDSEKVDIGKYQWQKQKDNFQLRDPSTPYNDHFKGKKADIGPENTTFRSTNL